MKWPQAAPLAAGLVLAPASVQAQAVSPGACGGEQPSPSKQRQQMSSPELDCVYKLHGYARTTTETAVRALRTAVQANPARYRTKLVIMQCVAARREGELLDFEIGRRGFAMPAQRQIVQITTAATVRLAQPPAKQFTEAYGAEAFRLAETLHLAFNPRSAVTCRY